MGLTLDNPALKLYALSSAILAIHLVLLAFWTGTVRSMRKAWVNPEDAKLLGGKQVEVDHPDVLRTKRAHQNALENAVPFFAVGLAFVVAGGSASGAKVYFLSFVAARLLHSIFYLWGRQPFRTLAFTVGALAILGMGVQVVMLTL